MHTDGLATERQALERVEPHLSSMRARILAAISAAGERGLLPDEWAAENRALINTARRRFTDLWKDGMIRHHPAKIERPNAAGNPCVVWVAGADPQGTRTREQSMREEIARLRAKVEQLERELADLRRERGLLL